MNLGVTNRGLLYRTLRAIYRGIPLPLSFKRDMIAYLVNSSYRFRRFVGSEGLKTFLRYPRLSPPKEFEPYKPEQLPAERPGAVLVIDFMVPEPDRDSGSLRFFQILEILREADVEVTFVAQGKERAEPYAQNLEAMGISLIFGEEAAVDHLAQDGLRYGTVILSRPELTYRFLYLVKCYAPMASRVYDTVDLHWVRLQRESELNGDRKLARLSMLYKKIELQNAESCDVSVTVTEDERQMLLAEKPDLSVVVIPNIHACVDEVPSFSSRQDLLFVGNYLHPPNMDAVVFFADEILPLVRQELPDVRLKVVGSHLPMNHRSLAQPGLEPIGFVQDLHPVIDQSRVFVSPLRFGAGMKGKIGGSLCRGLPVVTTAIGAEGIGLIDGETALIADDPETFAAAIIRLYRDEALWQRISTQSLEHIRKNFSGEAIRPAIAEVCGLKN